MVYSFVLLFVKTSTSARGTRVTATNTQPVQIQKDLTIALATMDMKERDSTVLVIILSSSIICDLACVVSKFST